MAKGTREKRPVPPRRKKAKALPQSGVPAGAGVYALVGAERRRVLSKISNYSKGHQSEAAAVGRALHVLGELIRAGHPKTAKSFKRCVEAAIAKTDTAKPYTCQRKASSIACPFCLLEIQLAVVEWMRTEPRLNADAAEWVTVAAPSWQRPLGQLKDFSIRNAKARVYAALLDRARDALGAGDSVVLDASWHAPAPRRGAAALAEETGARLDALRCVAPEALCRERVRRRSAEGDDPSEATPAVADWMAAAFTPWPEAVAIDTAGPVEDSVRDAKTALEPSPSDVK